MKRLVAVLLLVGCAHRVALWQPDGGAYHAFTPEPYYRTVWDSTMRCAAPLVPVAGDRFADMTWEVMDSVIVYYNSVAHSYALAAWDPESKRIYFGRDQRGVSWVIAHEALHAGTHTLDHPAELFNRCVSPWWINPPTWGPAPPDQCPLGSETRCASVQRQIAAALRADSFPPPLADRWCDRPRAPRCPL